MLKFIFAILLITSLSAKEEFAFKGPGCKVRVPSKKKLGILSKTFFNKLKEKKMVPQAFIKGKKLIPGEYYFHVSYSKGEKKFWKDCIVNLKLLKSKSTTPSFSDPIFFEKKAKRSFPRITPSGSERCVRALRDAFVHIPECK